MRRGNNATMMDKKKTFGKRVIRNNVEVMNPFPEETQGYDYSYQQQQYSQGYDQYASAGAGQYQYSQLQQYGNY